MRTPSKILAVAALAAAIPLGAASAQTIYGGGYYDDGYYAYGAAPGYGYRAAPDGYYAYGAAPSYRYGSRRQWNYGNGSSATGPGSSPMCPADREQANAYPSWMCR